MNKTTTIANRMRTLSLCLVFALSWLGPEARAAETPQEVLAKISQRCASWLGPPPEEIRSLRYAALERLFFYSNVAKEHNPSENRAENLIEDLRPDKNAPTRE